MREIAAVAAFLRNNIVWVWVLGGGEKGWIFWGGLVLYWGIADKGVGNIV